jgi:transposase
MARKRKYGAEFKAEAVKLLSSSGRPLVHVAAELGIPPSTLESWADRAKEKSSEDGKLFESERDELLRLRRENERLRMEREILKKAAAFFAKENS